MNLSFDRFSIPILILSDAPEALTGLARIGRDLAGLLCTLPQFRVGYLGRGGVGRVSFPWTQYSYPEAAQWGDEYLPGIWEDFSRGKNGIILSTWDASRMLWFGAPEKCRMPIHLQKFLGSGRGFEKWAYLPVDSTGPDGSTLGIGMAEAVAGYDRVIAASEWGRDVLVRSGRIDADWLPHGIFLNKFKPNDTAGLINYENKIQVGCVMANQARKDWPVAFETAALLRAEYGNKFRFWCHTDDMIRYWNIYALAADYGIADCLEITTELNDAQLALRYSSCDCTILPTAGEGFGYPIAESLACGTACITTDYAAGQELVPREWCVEPVTYRTDTIHNVRRAVLSGYGFAAKAKDQIEKKRADREYRSEEIRATIEHLDWERLKHTWVKWFVDGVRECR